MWYKLRQTDSIPTFIAKVAVASSFTVVFAQVCYYLVKGQTMIFGSGAIVFLTSVLTLCVAVGLPAPRTEPTEEQKRSARPML